MHGLLRKPVADYSEVRRMSVHLYVPSRWALSIDAIFAQLDGKFFLRQAMQSDTAVYFRSCHPHTSGSGVVHVPGLGSCLLTQSVSGIASELELCPRCPETAE